MRRLLKRFAAPFLVLALAWLSASCATVFTRGVVRDPAGQPIGNASVRVTSVESGKLVMATVTDAAGCFNLHEFPPERGSRHFRLDISVAGSKPVSLLFNLQTPVLEGTLATESSAGESRLTPLTNEQAYARWELICAPPSPVGN